MLEYPIASNSLMKTKKLLSLIQTIYRIKMAKNSKEKKQKSKKSNVKLSLMKLGMLAPPMKSGIALPIVH